MGSVASGGVTSGRTVVVVPVKGFGAAKGRLGDALAPDDRAALARRLATGVIEAAAPLPVLVVTDDDDVDRLAVELGADVVRQREPGLNAAVTEGVAAAAAAGYDRVVVAHADLPRPEGLPSVVAHADLPRPAGLAAAGATASCASDVVVLVPDRHGDGTNVLVVPTDAGFRFAYGPGSAVAHRAEAERLGLTVEVVVDADLGWDVDTPADLTALDDDRSDPAGRPATT